MVGKNSRTSLLVCVGGQGRVKLQFVPFEVDSDVNFTGRA